MKESETKHLESDAGVEPRNVDEAKRVVEETRERISSTLDTLEDRIIETRDLVRDKANVLEPLRERARARPWMAVAVAAAAGLFLGTLSRRRHRELDPAQLALLARHQQLVARR